MGGFERSPQQMMLLRALVLPVSLIFLVGCKNEITSKNPSLSNAELLELMQGELFEVQVPKNISSDHFAGLAIKYSDGSIDPMGCSNSWVPDETVKIICFSPEKNIFRYAYFRESGSGRGETTNFPITRQVSANAKRSGLSENERLVRYSRDNSIRILGEPHGDDFDVVFHVQPTTKGEQARAGNPLPAE